MTYAKRIERGGPERGGPEPATRRISGPTVECLDPSHGPPAFQLFESGTYEHRCPSCGHLTYFTVRAIRA